MKTLLSGWIVLSITVGAVGATTPQYTPRFLGAYTGITAVNASGQVVGTANVPFRGWVAGPLAPAMLLPLPEGRISSYAKDINDAGVIVGAVSAYSSPDFSPEAARWTPNGSGGYTIDLLGGKLPGDLGAVATALNDVGDVVGFSKGSMFRRAVWFTAPGGVMDLTPLGIFDPNDINDGRVLVDSSSNTKLLDLDTMQVEELGLPAGSYNSTWGYAINEANQVAGNALLATGTSCNRQAARFTGGTGWEILSACASGTQASGINDLGDTIWRHALDVYIRLEGVGTFKVQDLIVSGVGRWTVVNTYAIDLNNARQLAVWASNDTTGENGTVLLTPTCTAAPAEVADVRFDSRSLLRWSSSGATYDVARGDLRQAREGSLDCLATGESQPQYQDGALPALGGVLAYRVRAVDACGTGPWGGATSAVCP
jgi:hypothetical protein